MQPINRSDGNNVIMNILNIRRAANKKLKCGRKFCKLSEVAAAALGKDKVGKFFWQRFEAKHESLTRKCIGHTSLARAVACTEEMAIEHIDSLAEELIMTGIMTNYKQIRPDVWNGNVDGAPVFNRDETPQAICYGEDGTANNLAYCSKGERCVEIRKENREFVTIEPFVSLNGKIANCHVIFSSEGHSSAMAPKVEVEKISGLLVSTTENAYQNRKSCLGSMQTV